ncbi:hypothetical protein DFA_08097 [Cavenderia fasciculata]|uniref:Uncharacterized protein n=1 Tax=Cavenderia fasciculata TaxID=261658 RepID=F4Q509_CACFS|nr:uncharacterized protein DFA_08097 [Cavenderia fasciculata]EGG17115.1 hypothetical protein DFA_08097 [Cavenderia fasciculata]|eukprot:XP_004355599.1 hypothetical protein DFA_08097 [Cavenderia fasciculata]
MPWSIIGMGKNKSTRCYWIVFCWIATLFFFILSLKSMTPENKASKKKNSLFLFDVLNNKPPTSKAIKSSSMVLFIDSSCFISSVDQKKVDYDNESPFHS